MIDFYNEQLVDKKRELELITTGVIAQAGTLIASHVEPVADDKLTLSDVCIIADSLNNMLEAIHKKQKDIEYTERQIDLIEAKAKELDDDNHK